MPNTNWQVPGFDVYIQYLDSKLQLLAGLAEGIGKPFIAEEFGARAVGVWTDRRGRGARGRAAARRAHGMLRARQGAKACKPRARGRVAPRVETPRRTLNPKP